MAASNAAEMSAGKKPSAGSAKRALSPVRLARKVLARYLSEDQIFDQRWVWR